MEVPIPYIRPIFQAYVSEYPHSSYGLFFLVQSCGNDWCGLSKRSVLDLCRRISRVHLSHDAPPKMETHGLLHFISFYYTLYHFIPFYIILLHFITLYIILFHFITFYYILLHFITFYYTLLHFITCHYILYHFITFYVILLHLITLYYILLHILLHFITFYYMLLQSNSCTQISLENSIIVECVVTILIGSTLSRCSTGQIPIFSW